MGACVTCHQQITNPLSPQRLALQMKVWLSEARPGLLEEFEERASLYDYEAGEDTCIKNHKPMQLCAYCFTEHIYNWLVIRAPQLITQYLTFFNYDEANLGYIKNAQEKGLIV